MKLQNEITEHKKYLKGGLQIRNETGNILKKKMETDFLSKVLKRSNRKTGFLCFVKFGV